MDILEITAPSFFDSQNVDETRSVERILHLRYLTDYGDNEERKEKRYKEKEI